MTTTMIEARGLWKFFGHPAKKALGQLREQLARNDDPSDLLAAHRLIPALRDVSFSVAEGESFVIMGLSGSGKSTLLRCLSRLIEPSFGDLRLDGRDLLTMTRREMIELRRTAMGMVFQNFGLLQHLTVLENVAFPLRVRGVAPEARARTAQKMVEMVGLARRESAMPRELSGGQQQRVGIARSLAGNPSLWFLDEPFSALDPLIRREMQDEVLRLQKMLRKTIVFVTHDIQEAFRLADRMMVMHNGRIVQIGRPAELLLSPVDDYVASFMEDVPRGKVLKAGDLADPGTDVAADWPTVSAAAPLESLLPMFVAGRRGVAVTTPDGGLAGGLSAEKVMRAVAFGAGSDAG